MKRNWVAIIVYVIIAFAAIGLISQLFGDTKSFIFSIIFMIGIAAAVFALLNYFVNRSSGLESKEMKKYKAAVRKSKGRYQQPKTKVKHDTKPKQQAVAIRKNKRRSSHLRVIEGNKSKRKDSASS